MKGKEQRKGGRQEERERKEERKAEKCAVPKYSNSNREQVPDSEQNSERSFCSSLLLAPTLHGGVQTTKKKIKKEGREEQFTPLPLLPLSLSTVGQCKPAVRAVWRRRKETSSLPSLLLPYAPFPSNYYSPTGQRVVPDSSDRVCICNTAIPKFKVIFITDN